MSNDPKDQPAPAKDAAPKAPVTFDDWAAI